MDRIGIYLFNFSFFPFLSSLFQVVAFPLTEERKLMAFFWFLPNKAFQVGACLWYFASYIINHDAFTQSQLNGTTYLDKD